MVLLWDGLGWMLLAAGLGVLAWALFWDRAGWRGRASLRCRGCWYDLTGAGDGVSADSPVVCSECGRAHRSRRTLRRTRRRWGWAVVSGALLVGAHGAWVAPDVQKRGWGAAVPGVVLVCAVPLLSDTPGSAMGVSMPERRPPAWQEWVRTQLTDEVGL